ncbi:MAG TPA: flagellar hook-basal body complex protein FliE [Methanosarcinales archaeon]|nr:flagellar hook-basal body complex protein FliE [Methanosarcinales archaeon]
MRIIAFVGMPASGKSRAAQLARERDIPVVVMGDVIREEAKRCGLDQSDANIGGLGDRLRAEEGMDAVAKRSVPMIRKLQKDTGLVVIDGIRGLAEVDLFRKEFGDDFMLISIVAPIDIRLERISRRERTDVVTDMDSLKARDERELRWGMGEALESAAHVIRNTGTLDEFLGEVESVIDRMRRDLGEESSGECI